MNPDTRRYFAEFSIEMAATPAAVWAVLSDFRGVDKWSRGVRVSPLGSIAQGMGAGRHCEIQGLGAVDEVVFQWEPEQRLSYRVSPVSLFGPSISRWWIESAGLQKTHVTQRFEYDMRFGVIGALLHALVVKRKLAEAQPKVLKQLKKHVESSGAG